MAEAVGLVISGLGLVSLVNTVTECFEKIAVGRNLGKDYEQYTIQLEMSNLAYNRWLSAVRIKEPDESSSGLLELPTATVQEAAFVKKLLGQIIAAFEDAEKVATKYEVQDQESAPRTEADLNESETVQLGQKILETAKKQRKALPLREKLRWTFRNRRALQDLTKTVCKNVQSLTTMFPPVMTAIERLAAEDVTQIASSGNTHMLEQLRDVARSADPMLEKPASQALTGHVYHNTGVEDDARALYGDQRNHNGENGENGSDPGRRHLYSNTTAKGKSKAHYGDRVNMKDFLND